MEPDQSTGLQCLQPERYSHRDDEDDDEDDDDNDADDDDDDDKSTSFWLLEHLPWCIWCLNKVIFDDGSN